MPHSHFGDGPMIAGDLKFHDRPRFTMQCDCKFRYMIYYDSTTTYWPGTPWLWITQIVYKSQKLTKIDRCQSFSIIATTHQSSSIVITHSHQLPFVTFPSKIGKCDQVRPSAIKWAKVHLDSLLLDSIAVVAFLCYVCAHRLHVAAAVLALVSHGHIWACLGFFKLVWGLAKQAQSWTLDSNIAVPHAIGADIYLISTIYCYNIAFIHTVYS